MLRLKAWRLPMPQNRAPKALWPGPRCRRRQSSAGIPVGARTDGSGLAAGERTALTPEGADAARTGPDRCTWIDAARCRIAPGRTESDRRPLQPHPTRTAAQRPGHLLLALLKLGADLSRGLG